MNDTATPPQPIEPGKHYIVGDTMRWVLAVARRRYASRVPGADVFALAKK